MRAVLLALVLLSAPLVSKSEEPIRFGIVTRTGYVQFTVPADWVVIATKTKSPISLMAFQVLNHADEGTPDSTNVGVMLYDLSDTKAQEASQTIGRQLGAHPVTSSEENGWTLYTQEAIQRNTTYVIIDAKRTVADVLVGIRCAWPRLVANPSDYDDRMKSTCQSLIRSVDGRIGKPDVQPGQQTYRPVN